MPATISASQRRLVDPVVAVIAGGYAVAAVIAVERSVPGLTSYAGASSAANVVDLCAGLGLVAAGLAARLEPTTRRLGAPALILAAAWFAPDFEGWTHGPAVVRSLGAAAIPLFSASLLHFVVTAPHGRIRTRLGIATVGAAYAVAVGVAVGRALFRDPFLETSCWRSCVDNTLLLHSDQRVANSLETLRLYSSLTMGVVAVGVCGWRLLTATRPAWPLLAPTLLPGMLVGAAEAAYAAALLRTSLEDPTQGEFASIFLARAVSLIALAVGLAWMVVHALGTRSALGRLATELEQAPAPGRLQEALRKALADPTLQVAYQLAGSGRYVAGDGAALELSSPDPDRVLTPIERAGRPIAVLVHAVAAVEGSRLVREIGSAARLAIDNDRLRAELLAQLEELRSSRARIVEAGDAARQRLERDLHDGAQQRLLALSYDLRVARGAAEAAGDLELAATLDAASEEADAALVELRDLAHGIHPAILTEAGLAPALETLADEAPLPVVLGEVSAARHAPPVEATAYACVTGAVADAASRGATFAEVEVRGADDRLVVTVSDDGTDRTDQLVHLVDRVGALRGVTSAGRTTFRAEIPCA